jgi:hypothetical protein
MHTHEGRRFRGNSRVLRKGLLPPVIEAVGGEVRIQIELFVGRISWRCGELIAV